MNDNSLSSIFGVDLGDVFGDIGNKYAESKGYSDLYSLGVGEASKNIARITDKAGGDTKQTPAVIAPGEWSKQISAALPFKVELSNTQMILGAVVLAGVVYLLIKR